MLANGTGKDAIGRKNSKQGRYPLCIQISVCLFGLLLYFSSYWTFVIQLDIIPEAMRQIGIGVLVFGLTSFVLTYWYSKLATEQVSIIGEEMKSLMRNDLDIVRSARDSGISRIYPLRTGEGGGGDASKAFHERVEQEFTKAAHKAIETNQVGTIKMMGISLRAFFSDAGDLYTPTKSALDNQSLKFQILLIDPFCTQAGIRSERESQNRKDQEYTSVEDHFSSTLFMDLQKCANALSGIIASDRPHAEIDVRLYSTAPSCFLILVNEIVFVETYHYGRSGVGGRRGGKVPVLEFHSDTSTYKELEGHFDHVWFKSRYRELYPQIASDIATPRTSELVNKLKDEFPWISEKQGGKCSDNEQQRTTT